MLPRCWVHISRAEIINSLKWHPAQVVFGFAFNPCPHALALFGAVGIRSRYILKYHIRVQLQQRFSHVGGEGIGCFKILGLFHPD